MKITAEELKDFGMIDGILPEGDQCFSALDVMLKRELERLGAYSKEELLDNRYKKYREVDKLYRPERGGR